MSTFETFYDLNPISVIDQNTWDEKMPEVALMFRTAPVIYTPLVDWDNQTQKTGAKTTIHYELLDGDTDVDEIPLTANYIAAPHTVDSRYRTLTTTRYGDKVQLHESSNIFQQWQLSGGRDWRPLLRGILGQNVVRKMELLSRNIYLKGPKSYWTYGNDATSWATLGTGDTFSINTVNAWNLRLGNIGSPVIPGDSAAAKVCIIPPGCVYDFMQSLAAASSNEMSMWRDTQIYSGKELRYEIGSYKNIRFVQHPNDRYGMNNSVLYNCGAIIHQHGVTAPIHMGDGAPDPETTKVDDVWYVGQKAVTHYIQLTDFAQNDYNVGDWVTIHVARTNAYGVTDGVDPLSGKTIVRRVVNADYTNNRLSFDRPIMTNYESAFVGTPNGGSAGTLYAYVTRGKHVGFVLVLGSRGGVMGEVARPLKFYEPKPIDDFESVWRYVWDFVGGFNIWEPNLFECHFVSVTLPKAGGVIAVT